MLASTAEDGFGWMTVLYVELSRRQKGASPRQLRKA